MAKKHNFFITFIAGLVICMSLTLWFIQHHKKVNIPTKPTVIKVVENKTIKPILLEPVNGLSKHTDFIGTTEEPTLDGGIINSADGIVVAKHDENIQQNNATKSVSNTLAMREHSVSKKQEESPQKTTPQTNNTNQAFKDDWATSDKVKKLLLQAVKDGKLEYILQKTNEHNLPASVATVPMIESNYKDKSLSPKGASGLWQLMPETAKDYGISHEERNKLQPSTEVALNLLHDLYKRFGNWELAFASYNAGAERVEKALKQNPKAQHIDDLNLPNETKNYVKHIMAVNKIMEQL